MIRKAVALGTLPVLVGLDRLTKIYFLNRPAESGPVLFPGWLELTRHENFGIIANLPIPRFIIIAISLVVIGFLMYSLVKTYQKNENRDLFALVLILAGAIGNVWDRIQWHFVFDWLLLFGMSAINAADVMIALGLIWFLLLRSKKSQPLFPDLPESN